MTNKRVAIIGAGMSGLTAALHLKRSKIAFDVYEKSAEVGGRIKSEIVEGLIVDHGFQIFLTSYPEALNVVNYATLDLIPLKKAFVLCKNRKKYFLEYPDGSYQQLIKMLRYPFMDLKSIWNMIKMVVYLRSTSLKKIFDQPDIPTEEFLRKKGFSKVFIEHTLQPFLKGIFLENQLKTSSKVFQYVLKMMLAGSVVVPSNGIGAIPKQLFHSIGKNHFHFFKTVEKINEGEILFEDGQVINADFIIDTRPQSPIAPANQNSLFVFVTPKKVLPSYDLAVFENNDLGISNLIQFSNFYKNSKQEEYVGISVNNTIEKNRKLRPEKLLTYIQQYFDTSHWKWIKTHHIPYGLNNQKKVTYSNRKKVLSQKSRYYQAGDWMLYGSSNAAIHSGKWVAEAIIQRIQAGD